MKATFYKEIERIVTEISDCITTYQGNINTICAKANKRATEINRDYKAEVIEQRVQEIQQKAKINAAVEREVAKLGVEVRFSHLRTVVDEWLAEAPTESILTILSASKNGTLPLSRSEVIGLTKTAAGNYFAMKALSQLAKESGFMFPHFMTIDEIERVVTQAETDISLVIDYYPGQFVNNRLPNRWIVEAEGYNQHFSEAFASGYNEKDENSLMRMKEALLSVTNTETALIPSQKERISKIFESCEDEEAKIEKMILAQKTSKSERALLKMYDPELYRQALERSRDIAHTIAEQKRKALTEVGVDAIRAKTREKELDAELTDAS